MGPARETAPGSGRQHDRTQSRRLGRYSTVDGELLWVLRQVVVAGLVATAALGPGAAVPATADNADVTLEARAFAPATVTIVAGESVTWTNREPFLTTHTVTADGAFDSSQGCMVGLEQSCLNPGEQFMFTFAQAGSYAYYCRLHRGQGMVGTVQVTDPPTTTTTAPPTSTSPPTTARVTTTRPSGPVVTLPTTTVAPTTQTTATTVPTSSSSVTTQPTSRGPAPTVITVESAGSDRHGLVAPALAAGGLILATGMAAAALRVRVNRVLLPPPLPLPLEAPHPHPHPRVRLRRPPALALTDPLAPAGHPARLVGGSAVGFQNLGWRGSSGDTNGRRPWPSTRAQPLVDLSWWSCGQSWSMLSRVVVWHTCHSVRWSLWVRHR